MNAGIVTSFVVGGMLLLSVLSLNFTLMETSAQSTLSLVSKTNVETISQILNNDFMKMGYTQDPQSFPISAIDTAKANKITFRGDVDRDGDVDIVTWSFNSGDSVDATSNPDDSYIKRKINGSPSEKYSAGLTSFKLAYNTSRTDETAWDGNINPDSLNILQSIKRVRIRLVSESAEPVGEKVDKYGKKVDDFQMSIWQKEIVPPNLNRSFKTQN